MSCLQSITKESLLGKMRNKSTKLVFSDQYFTKDKEGKLELKKDMFDWPPKHPLRMKLLDYYDVIAEMENNKGKPV